MVSFLQAVQIIRVRGPERRLDAVGTEGGGALRERRYFCGKCFSVSFFRKFLSENTLFFRSEPLGYELPNKERQVSASQASWRYDETFQAKFETQSSP